MSASPSTLADATPRHSLLPRAFPPPGVAEEGRAADRCSRLRPRVLDAEAAAILGAKGRLGASFIRALELMLACEGHIVVTGLGKPGFIAQKLSATLASTGVPSLYLHPSEALHGDLGRVSRGDVVLALSNSGSTEELVRLLPSLRRLGAQVIAITGDGDSPARPGLGHGARRRRHPRGMSPGARFPPRARRRCTRCRTRLAMTLLKTPPVQQRGVRGAPPRREAGRSVMRVLEVMRAGPGAIRWSAPTLRSHEAVVVMTNTPGRPGATNVVDASGRLVGIFTDGDLRRMVERRTRAASTCRCPRGDGTSSALRVDPRSLALTAAALMREAHVDQLPVVERERQSSGSSDVAGPARRAAGC